MRIELASADGIKAGIGLTKLIRELSVNNDSPVDAELMHSVEHGFCTLGADEQSTRFSEPFWMLMAEQAAKVKGNLLRYISLYDPTINNTKVPIVPGFKEGIDLILEVFPNGENLIAKAINVDKGGLASNTSEALVKLNSKVNFVSIHGDTNLPIASLHRELLEAAGIRDGKLINPGIDACIHPCIVFGDEKQEFWLVQKRKPFASGVIDEFRSSISEASRQNSGEVLVLSALPPASAPDDFLLRLHK